MNASNQHSGASNGQFLVYREEDGKVRIEVRLADETVWLTQQQMAGMFQTTVPNISMHLRNVFANGELLVEATVKEFLCTGPSPG